MITHILGFQLLFLWWSWPTATGERIQIRPNLYFGARERKPIGATFGLGWFFPEISSSSIRYECKEDDSLVPFRKNSKCTFYTRPLFQTFTDVASTGTQRYVIISWLQ